MNLFQRLLVEQAVGESVSICISAHQKNKVKCESADSHMTQTVGLQRSGWRAKFVLGVGGSFKVVTNVRPLGGDIELISAHTHEPPPQPVASTASHLASLMF